MGPLEGPIILVAEDLECDGCGGPKSGLEAGTLARLEEDSAALARSKLLLELLQADTLSLTVFRSVDFTPEAN